MPAVETTVVSGRVPIGVRNRVDKILNQQGTTPSELIALVYERIDSQNDWSWVKPQQEEKTEDNYAKLLEIIDRVPQDTPLSTMTDEELRNAWRRRDLDLA